jgi:acyl carrier protein
VSAPSDAELRQLLLEALRRVAPEADASALAPDAELREELEIDSIDVLNLAIALHETTGVEIPERDYAELSTLARGVAYLRRRLHG